MPKKWAPVSSLKELRAAVFSNDKATVRELVGGLVEHVNTHHSCYDPAEAGSILNLLRRRRMFEEMRRAADAFLNNGCLTLLIRKYYAQALIDLGYLSAAEDVLTKLNEDAYVLSRESPLGSKEGEDAVKEWAESCGLLGRVYKDRYVNAGAPDVERNQQALKAAIGHYYACYAADEARRPERHWQGINAVALARRAGDDDVGFAVQFDAGRIAETILREVEISEFDSERPLNIWGAATAMEAGLALRDWKQAYHWAEKYVSPKTAGADRIDAFEVGSTLRQLEEVWRLKVAEEPGSLLLPLLRTRLQELEGFNFVVGGKEPINPEFLAKQADSLEKQFGGQFLSFRTYCEGVSRGRSVARIGLSPEEHVGTGFLIEGGDLDPRLTGQRLVLTCDHVVSNVNANSLNPRRAVVTFRAEADTVRQFGVSSVAWSSPEGDLDVSVLRLDGDTGGLPVVPWARSAPTRDDNRVLIFGHAVGGALSFSLGDNRLVDLNERFIQYRAPTVGGSSGSPVFNLEWELVAVHHRGGYAMKRLTADGLHEANQGSSVFALREEARRNPQQLFGQ